MAFSAEDARLLYSVDRWSEGLFDINDGGRVSVHPKGRKGPSILLDEVIERAQETELCLPLLIRFTDILRTRVQRLEKAFASVRKRNGYAGDYAVIYPIKVNQRRFVVEEILNATERVGLEAGSKPELLAVLACSRPGGRVICNGYKDSEYIRMALIGKRLGLRVILVVEKPAELDRIIEISRTLGIRPSLGIRLRLSSIGHGKWQNTGGDKAKFGLSPSQLLQACDQLRDNDMLDCLELLHFHMGSQISNLRDIHAGAAEGARYYAELAARGATIRCLDVGGGLAVDYEGAASRGYFSMNYGLEQYANAVLTGISEICDEHDLPHPDVLSESGRALTAHHAVLIMDVIAAETTDVEAPARTTADPVPQVLQSLRDLEQEVQSRPPAELYQDTRYLSAEAKERFLSGHISLEQRAEADERVVRIFAAIRGRLKLSRRSDRNADEELRRLLAHKYFCNFSLFRSLPDVWAIDQVFPILPVNGLDAEPTERAVLEDLTCDSDGRIDYYVEADGLEPTLPLHRLDPDRPYRLAVFMVGAYQEILGDDHNLFGKTHSVDVSLKGDGDFWIHHQLKGDDAGTVLADVGFHREWLLERLRDKISRADELPSRQGELLLQTIEQSLRGYTYLAAG